MLMTPGLAMFYGGMVRRKNVIGTLATGLFAQKAINPAGADGLFFGNPKLFVSRVIAITVTVVYSFVVTAIMLKVLDNTVGLRVDDESKVVGLDISQHGGAGICCSMPNL